MQKSNDLLWVILIGVVIWFISQQNKPAPSPTPQPGGRLAQIVTNASDRATLAQFYKEFADVVRRDSTVLTGTGQLRTAHANSAKLLLQGTSYQKYPGLDQAISDMLKASIGLEDTAVDAAKRAVIVSTLESIAHELGG